MMSKKSTRVVSASLLTACLAASSAFGARVNEEAGKTLQRLYPKAEFSDVTTETFNGVDVYNVKVAADGETSTAQISENGDILFYGMPRSLKRLDQQASDALQGLLKTKPSDVETYRTNTYEVEMKAGKRLYELHFNAVGQLMNIERLDTQERKSTSSDVSRSVRDSMTKVANQYVEGAKIESIEAFPEAEGYYTVHMTGEDGLGRHMTANPDGLIWEDKRDLKRDTLPEPIRQSLSSLFEEGGITRLSRTEVQYYQFRQPAGDQVLTVRMHPNGDIFRLTTTGGVSASKRKQAAGADTEAETERPTETRQQRNARRARAE